MTKEVRNCLYQARALGKKYGHKIEIIIEGGRY